LIGHQLEGINKNIKLTGQRCRFDG